MDKKTAQKGAIWFFINGIAFYSLCMGTFGENEVFGNVIKFVIWLNFITWVLVLFSGEEAQVKIRKKGIVIGKYGNCIYGFVFSIILAEFGWFGYAGMEISVMFIQQIVFFGED